MRTREIALCTMMIVPASGFQNLFKNFGKAAVPAAPVLPTLGKKAELLESISYTNNGKSATPETQLKVLDLVRSLEMSQPPSENLLSDPKEAAILDGVWYLQYTSPSDPAMIAEGEKDQFPEAWKPQNVEDNITTNQVEAKGSISAAGIKVNTDNREVKQILNVQNPCVTNEIELDFGKVCVGGPFRVSEKVPNRAVVSFEKCDITLNNGLELKLGFLFDIRKLFVGTKEAGWLETTYIDDSMRIGRGNKGTMFVLTRNKDDVKP